MRVIVCGGRDFVDKDTLYATLPLMIAALRNRAKKYGTPITIIEGDARGADKLAGQYAEENGLRLEVYPADWEKYGKGAGAIRNLQMLSTGVDGVVAYPGGAGTQNMITIAELAGVPVTQLRVGGLLEDGDTGLQETTTKSALPDEVSGSDGGSE